MSAKRIISLILALGMLAGVALGVRGAEAQDEQQGPIGPTPPRLSLVDGQVSFWRLGAQDWAQAQVNTPLVPGDELATGSPGNLEIQVGPRAFVRGWARTQLGLENQEPDFLQFKVTGGQASFDLRALDPGSTVEVDTPNAAFTIARPGYYRAEVSGDRTSFITRRGGQATVTPANGQAVAVAASEEVVIVGTTNPQIASYVAPQLDEWDRWNYARTDALLDSVSGRYVPAGTYGVDDLDTYGTWRVVPSYGSVWVPNGMPSGWVPYSTGSWILDPVYGWTWVDTAPWGWAPYHHGRWVNVDGFWAWAPGPMVARPAYAPALVAFFGAPGVSVSVGGPMVGWVALGWGEPLVPWWGREGFIHRPWWGGWGGPRVVNNVVVTNTTVVNVQNITVYHNARVRNAVVVVNEDRFGHGPIRAARLNNVDVRDFHPIHTAPQVAATPASFVPTARRGIRPSEEILRRPVVATRESHHGSPGPGGEHNVGPAGVPRPAPRIVSVPQHPEAAPALPRPPFGQSKIERPRPDRSQVPSPPGREATRREPQGVGPSPTAPSATPGPPRREGTPTPPAGASVTPPAPGQTQVPPRREGTPTPPQGIKGTPPTPPVTSPAPPPGREATRREPQRVGPSPVAPPPSARRVEAPGRPLPGEPANRLSPNRAENRPPQQGSRPAAPDSGRPAGGPEKGGRERQGDG